MSQIQPPAGVNQEYYLVDKNQDLVLRLFRSYYRAHQNSGKLFDDFPDFFMVKPIVVKDVDLVTRASYKLILDDCISRAQERKGYIGVSKRMNPKLKYYWLELTVMPSPRHAYRAVRPMPQAWTYGDYVLRESRSRDVPVIAALEWACQTHPWQLERVEAFLMVPHEGQEQFALMASLERRPVGYAILAVGGGNMSIERIGVFPDHRRNRVATKLIAHAMLEARVRKCEFVSTVLRESNVAGGWHRQLCTK